MTDSAVNTFYPRVPFFSIRYLDFRLVMRICAFNSHEHYEEHIVRPNQLNLETGLEEVEPAGAWCLERLF